MAKDKVRNTYKTRAVLFFAGDKEKATKYQKYFNFDNEDLIALVDSPRISAEEKGVIQGIIDYNRVSVKSKSDTSGKSNLPFTNAGIEMATALLSKRPGDRIKVDTDAGIAEYDLVSVQVLVKYKDGDAVKTKSLDKHGNGITLEV